MLKSSFFQKNPLYSCVSVVLVGMGCVSGCLWQGTSKERYRRYKNLAHSKHSQTDVTIVWAKYARAGKPFVTFCISSHSGFKAVTGGFAGWWWWGWHAQGMLLSHVGFEEDSWEGYPFQAMLNVRMFVYYDKCI